MKKMKYLVLIIVISLVVTIGYTYAIKNRENRYSGDIFNVSYDNTWKAEKSDTGVKLIHKKTYSILNIQFKKVDKNYLDTKLNDIISDVMYSIEQQNRGYKLINKSDSPSDKYESFSYLYEGEVDQTLVNVYKKDDVLIIAYYTANNDCFDIILDSVDDILDSLEIITGELIK